MDHSTLINTPHGNVSLGELIRVYDTHKKANLRHQAKRQAFNQTEQGKELNRQRSKDYYYKHRAEILEKRAEQYQARLQQID